MRAVAWALAAIVFFFSGAALAQDADPTVRAREEYARGNELAKSEDWSEALAAFRRSYDLRAHPATAYNIATCHRVLGQYTAARALFEDVLRPGNVEQLPSGLADNARGYAAELERIVAHVEVTLDPPESEIAIDGRPLKVIDGGVVLAGVLPSGPGTTVPSRTFELVVDPGTRVIVISRKGYKEVVRSERFLPGSRGELHLDLERLPATLRITANIDRSIVTVNGVDVGMAPVDVSRAPGQYRVVVSKEGFVPHAMTVKVEPGEDPKLAANLVPERTPITKKWWFWTGAVAIVAGGVALTYALARDPQPPAYETGSTGWLVDTRGQ